MPFCNKCGTEIAAGAAFCPHCGSRNVGGASAAARPQMAAPAAPPPRQGMGLGAKIAIIIGAAILIVIVALVGAGAYFASHVRHVRTADGRTEVVTPFGTVGTGQPSDRAARELGIAIYPGAQAEPSARVDFGEFHADVLRFRTNDSPAQVLAFYQKQYSNSLVQSTDRHTLSIVDHNLQFNVEVHSRAGATEFTIRQSRQ